MQKQFLRKVIVELGGTNGLRINGDLTSTNDMRVQFSIDKSISSQPNTSSLTLYNLNPEHRGMLAKEFYRINIYAGYQGELGQRGNIALIFSGDIRAAQHQSRRHSSSSTKPAVTDDYQNGDWITTIQCTDGGSALAKGVVSKTYDAGTPVKDVMLDLAKTLPDVTIGNVKGLDDAGAFDRPYSVMGSSRDYLNEIGRTKKVYWGINDGVFESIPASGSLDSVIVLAPNTGMVGTPSLTDKGIEVDALLNPALKPGRIIEVRSQIWTDTARRRFRISAVSFKGDNMEGDFIASVTGENL